MRNSRPKTGASVAAALGGWVLVSLAGALWACGPRPAAYEVEILVPGSHFHGVHGLTFDGEDRLYAGSVVGQTIYRIDVESGEVEEFIPGPEGMADDLEFGPDGQLVWTSFLVGVVHGRRGEDGPIETLATGLPGINSLAFDPQGRLFATQVFLADALYEIDPEGEEEPRKVLEGMGGLNGFDFGPDGKLYGPLWFKGEVARIDVDRGELVTVAGGFKTPAAANFDSKGRLFVLDTAAGEVVEVQPETGERRVVAQVPTGVDNLALDSRDRLFVSNFADNSIVEVDPGSGEVRTVVAGGLSVPGGLALYSGAGVETLYLADTFAFRAVDPATGAVTDLARMHADELEYPSAVAVNDEHVVLASWFTGTLQRLDRRTGASLELLHGFNAPGAVLALDDGRVLVAELGSGELFWVLPGGGGEGAGRQTLATGLDQPAGLAAGADGTLYVTEAGAGTLSRIDAATGARSLLVQDLQMPEGVAVTADGQVVVAEVGARRIIAVDPATGAVEVVAEDLPVGLPAPPGAPPVFTPTGLAAGGDGTMYFTSDLENAIYRIRRVE